MAGASDQRNFGQTGYEIAIGNCDDHFRNHGFLLTRSGRTLSPAYDLNPTTRENQSLLINDNTDKSDLKVLFKSASFYFLTKARAKAIIEEFVEAVAGWRSIAQELRLARSDAQRLGSRFVVGLKR